MKIVTIVGARPQFIKAASVSRAIVEHNRQSSASITEVIVHTGQHYDHNMSEVFFRELEIPEPDINLEIGSGTHGRQTGQMLMHLEGVLLAEKPDWVLVYGDTNSTLAGALAAVKLHLPVAHVESGLRSFNRKMPEEINRVLTDHVANFLFCPTQQAVDNLIAEGIGKNDSSSRNFIKHSVSDDPSAPNQTISLTAMSYELPPKLFLTGDVMYDSVLYNLELAKKKPIIMDKPGFEIGTYALATVHRAENTDNDRRLISIFKAFDQLSANGLPVVIPLHPRTRKIINESGLTAKNVQIIEPVSYLDMLLLEKQAKVILTDSGGVQKEAYWMKVPCITLRDETEWTETVESGWNVLAGADAGKILEFASNCGCPARQEQLFGDGHASEKIVAALINKGFIRN